MLIYSEQSPFFQYVPLPLFFAEDKLSFYKVMSDSQGYKHIHYVKDVSIFFLLLYLCEIKCAVTFIMYLVLSVIFTNGILLRAKQHLLPLASGKSSSYPN